MSPTSTAASPLVSAFSWSPEWVTAWATVALVLLTLFIEHLQSSRNKRLSGLQLLLEYKQKYSTSPYFTGDRFRVAKHYSEESFDFQQSVGLANLFEDLGVLFTEGYIDVDAVLSVFGVDVLYYWTAYEPFIRSERTTFADKYTNFEELALAISNIRGQPRGDQIKKFFVGETTYTGRLPDR